MVLLLLSCVLDRLEIIFPRLWKPVPYGSMLASVRDETVAGC